MPNMRRFTRAEGDDGIYHLVFSMHGEGSTDGYPYSLCGKHAPHETPSRIPEDGEPQAEACDRCTRLAAGEQLRDEDAELGPDEISVEEMARRFAAGEDEPVPVAAAESDAASEVRPLPDEAES